ncbi:MAG: hypothetical protein ACJ8EY_05550 [Sphingomicrobium sp.]
MTVIHYRLAKLGFTALICATGAAVLAYVAALGQAGIFALGGAGALAYVAFLNGRGALGGQPALRWDEHGVSISTLYRSTTLRWDELRDIRTQSLTLRYMGIIPVSRQDFLTFITTGGPFSSKTLKLAGSQLELPAGGIAGVHSALCAFLSNGAVRPAAPAVERPSSETEMGGFDPDAAIARYLASKQAESAVAAPSESPFASAPRPVFGRRQA